jgi:CRP/FNR family transcriptional regulator, cyclic AMP receptor protein
MPISYNFQFIEDCLKCTLHEERLFRSLSGETLRRLQNIKATSVYPKGAMLCLEGQPPRGVFVLCTGRAKLSTTSSEGKTVILRIAGPGEFLGLTAAISGTPYEASVETLEPSQANFISQADFVRFLQEYPSVGAQRGEAGYPPLQMRI